MFLVGIFHLCFGSAFFVFTSYGVQLFLSTPGEEALVIIKGLSGICFAFGFMNLMARKSADGPALNAVLIGTLFYLLFTVSCDIRWIQTGVLKPLAWASIGIRLLFTCGYAYYLTVRRERLH